MQDVTSKGKELIERWQAASRRVASLRADMEKAARELQTSEEQLAIWLLPDDAKEGEKFCVWYGDSLIGAVELENGYEVTIRQRGKSLLVYASGLKRPVDFQPVVIWRGWPERRCSNYAYVVIFTVHPAEIR